MTQAVKQELELVKNAADRRVPTVVNGREEVPFQGVDQHIPTGRKATPPIRSNMDFPDNGDKRVPDLETALRRCGLSDGMTISSHHHLRDGDRVALTALQTAANLGVKDLRWVPERVLPVPRTCDRPDGTGSGAPHRRLNERAPGRLLLQGQNARFGSAAFPWRAVAGDSGWRGSHRCCGDRGTHGGCFRGCEWLAWTLGMWFE